MLAGNLSFRALNSLPGESARPTAGDFGRRGYR